MRRRRTKIASLLLSVSSLGLCCSHIVAQDPLAFDYYDRLRTDPEGFGVTLVEFHENSHVAKITVNEALNNHTDSNATKTYRLVNLATFMPFTSSASHTTAAVSLLAIHHFNHRNFGPIANQIGNDCDIRFTTEIFDTKWDRIGTAAQTSNLLDREPRNLSNPLPSAIIGSHFSSITQPQAILAAIQNIAQISPASTSGNLDDKEVYPLFARTCPSSEGEAAAIVDYYVDIGITRVAILYWSDAFGAALQRAFQERATAVGMETTNAGFSSEEAIPGAIEKLKRSKFQHIFVVAFSSKYQPIMKEAYRAKMANGQHAWLFYGPSQFSIQALAKSAPDSPLFQASTGVAIVNFEATPQRTSQKPDALREDEPLPEALETVNQFFRAEWNATFHDSHFMNYVEEKLPNDSKSETDGESPRSYGAPSVWSYFQYDAIISMGLAMCRADTEFFNGLDFINAFQAISFEGTSGQVEFNEYNTREYNTIKFTVWNMVPDEAGGVNEEGEQGFSLNPTSVYTGGQWEQFRRFVYADGQTTPPADLRAIEAEVDTINDPIRFLGIALASFMMMSYLACLLWAWLLARNQPVARASQQSFLTLVAVGSFVQAAAILPLSVDRSLASQNDNEGHLDRACMAVPWLYYMGLSLTCSALFAKTSRLVEILRTPEVDRLLLDRQDLVLWPFLIVGANSIVLTLWTSLSPLQYDVVRDGSTDVYGRLLSSYGMCRSRDGTNDPNWFWLFLLIFNVSALLIANWFSYRTRAIETEYQESKYIAFAMGTTIEAYVIGSAMQHATNDSPDANYVITIGAIFISSFVTAALIFIPKMVAHRENLQRRATQTKRINSPTRASVESAGERFQDQQSSEFSDDEGLNSSEFRPDSTHTTTFTISHESDSTHTIGVRVTHHPTNQPDGGVLFGGGSERAFGSRRFNTGNSL